VSKYKRTIVMGKRLRSKKNYEPFKIKGRRKKENKFKIIIEYLNGIQQ